MDQLYPHHLGTCDGLVITYQGRLRLCCLIKSPGDLFERLILRNTALGQKKKKSAQLENNCYMHFTVEL